MAVTLTSLADLPRMGFDDIIDVRAPAEFAEDHVPGAISLPVLSDDERARVGTIYKQVSPFTARKLGAALVARNAAAHLEGPLADKPGSWRPLVYCWRGGQRSGSFASILAQIGWRVETIAGGYKAWRGWWSRRSMAGRCGRRWWCWTGTRGRPRRRCCGLAARGVQVIDLEGMANHRGSLFGAMGPQPSQRTFEARLALALEGLDPARPVVVEAESSKVGECRVPPELWKAMVAAPRVALRVPRAARADYLARAYADLTADRARLVEVVGKLRLAHPREVIADWIALAEAGAFRALAEGLMERHYDPRYEKHRDRMGVPLVEVEAGGLGEAEIAPLVDGWPRRWTGLSTVDKRLNPCDFKGLVFFVHEFLTFAGGLGRRDLRGNPSGAARLPAGPGREAAKGAERETRRGRQGRGPRWGTVGPLEAGDAKTIAFGLCRGACRDAGDRGVAVAAGRADGDALLAAPPDQLKGSWAFFVKDGRCRSGRWRGRATSVRRRWTWPGPRSRFMCRWPAGPGAGAIRRDADLCRLESGWRGAASCGPGAGGRKGGGAGRRGRGRQGRGPRWGTSGPLEAGDAKTVAFGLCRGACRDAGDRGVVCGRRASRRPMPCWSRRLTG